jgi:3-oxoacyl-[acyl-carrier protein] reductase
VSDRQHVLVTGAASGIGARTARLLAGSGYAVTVLDLHDAADTVNEITASGGVADFVAVDVRDRAAIDAAAVRHGRLDAVVTSAGVYGRTNTLEDLDEADVELVLGVNVMGTLWTLQAAVPHLRCRGGRIVCVGSLAGRNGGVLSGPHYGASKGGVHATPVRRCPSAAWRSRRRSRP